MLQHAGQGSESCYSHVADADGWIILQQLRREVAGCCIVRHAVLLRRCVCMRALDGLVLMLLLVEALSRLAVALVRASQQKLLLLQWWMRGMGSSSSICWFSDDV